MPTTCWKNSIPRRLGRAWLLGLCWASPSLPDAEGFSYLEYFRRDTGRVAPQEMMERYATVIRHLSGFELKTLPEVVNTPRGDVASLCRKSAQAMYQDDGEEKFTGQTAMLRLLGIGSEKGKSTAPYPERTCLDAAGLYDPESKRILLVESAGRRTQAATLMHEMVHAAQDRTIGLSAYQERHYTSLDAALAASALLEGQAQAVTTLQTLRTLDADGADETIRAILSEPLHEAFFDGENSCASIAGFPYTAGSIFVLHRYSGDGVTAFQTMFDRVPASTEQVLHRDKFLADERPEQAPLQGAAHKLGKQLGGTLVYQTTLGELVIGGMLAPLGGATAATAAAGWNGDRAALIDRGENGQTLVLDTLWDSPKDAEEFAAALERWLDLPTDGPEEAAPKGMVTRRSDKRVVAILNPLTPASSVQSALEKAGI